MMANHAMVSRLENQNYGKFRITTTIPFCMPIPKIVKIVRLLRFYYHVTSYYHCHSFFVTGMFCTETGSLSTMGYSTLPQIAKQLPSIRPSTEPLPGSRRRFFNQQLEEQGRPRTATPFTDEERVKTPALGYNGWYAGKKAGKLGTINLHTGRISEADNEYLMITQTINSPKSNLPYLEAVPVGYSEQEKQVFILHQLPCYSLMLVTTHNAASYTLLSHPFSTNTDLSKTSHVV